MNEVLKKNLKRMLESVDMEHLEPSLTRILDNTADAYDFSQDMSFRRIQHAQDSIYEILREKKFTAYEIDELMNHVYLLGYGYRDLYFSMGLHLGAEQISDFTDK